MNEWMAFGVVAVICGLLAWLANLPAESASGDSGEADGPPADRSDAG